MTRSGLAGAAIVALLSQGTVPAADPSRFLTQPLLKGIYTADPSAHVFGGKLYIYPSHDIDAGVPADDLGSHFAMRDYHVLSMDASAAPVTDHGVALDIKDVPWAGRRCGRPTPRKRTARTTSISRRRTNRTCSASASPSGKSRRAVQGAARADRRAASASTRRVHRHRRPALHVLRRHLGRAAAALGDRHLPAAKDVYPANDQPALTREGRAARATTW